MNWYVYANGNPVVEIDPEGLYEETSSTWDNMWQLDSLGLAGKGAAAWFDGMLPFTDPFHSVGVYNPCDDWLDASQTMGGVTRDAMIAAVAAPTKVVLNKNVGGIEASWGSNFRVGWHRLPTKGTFRVPWARGRSLPHYHRRFPDPGGGIGRHRPWQGW
jgi:hypothetical protein